MSSVAGKNQEAHRALETLSTQLQGVYIERERVVTNMLVALLAREHIVLLGPPGTGKSAITNTLCAALGGANFSVLMTKFTVPEEVFGPISLVGLEQDRYERVTAGMLPEAEIGFLDEVFKANSAILNALLTLVNERAFDNGGKRVKVPLEMLVGASNELPQDESLGALWDRFMFRLWVDPIRSRDGLRGLLTSKAEPAVTATLSVEQLDALRAEVAAVVLPGEVVDTLLDLKDALAQEHGITASDRRWRKCMKLIAAHAVLSGRGTAEKTDIMVLVDSLWQKPEERAKIMGTMARVVSPALASALKVLDAATELVGSQDLTRLSVEDTHVGGRVVKGLGGLHSMLKQMHESVASLPQDSGVDKVTAKVKTMMDTVGRAALARFGGLKA